MYRPKKRDIMHSWIRKPSSTMMLVITKLICKFSTISISVFFCRNCQANLNICVEIEGPRIA